MNFLTLANTSIRNLTPYQPGKPIEELERELGITSSIKLASNENPLGASPKALVAAQEALLKSHIYPDGSYYELKEALSRFLKVNPNQLTVGNGSENILELIVKSYLSAGDSAVISQYAFLTIPIILQSYGVKINVAQATDWGHDVRNMINAIDNQTRVIFLVNPNNPTGTYTNTDDFELLLSNVPSHILIVLDEAYHEYIHQSDYPDTLSYLAKYPNLMITRTFSKAYGMSAMRLGYSISSPEIADVFNRARLPFNVNTIAAKAACAALNDQNHVKNTIKLNNDGLAQLTSGLNDLGISFIPSVGNFVTVEVEDGLAVYQALLNEGVIVRPLKAYDMPKHIRVTTGTPEENERFLQSLEKVLCPVS